MEASRIWLLAKSPRIRISGRGESSWTRVSSAMAADFCFLVIHNDARNSYLNAQTKSPVSRFAEGGWGFLQSDANLKCVCLYFVKSFFFHVLVHSLEKPREVRGASAQAIFEIESRSRLRLSLFEHLLEHRPIEIRMGHDAVVLLEISFRVHTEVDDLFFRDFVVFP